MGKLFVIEGVDASGKESQSKAISERLIADGYQVQRINFPNYESDSSALVKMYLKGDFGHNPKDVDPYIASTFFAVDRYASYTMSWKKDYEAGKIIIADRYTTSNIVHQASKISDIVEKNKFLKWLQNLEYGIYHLPEPDAVFFLDMPPEKSAELMKSRSNKITGKGEKDIHETDREHLFESYQNAVHVAENLKWHRIKCTEDDQIRPMSEITELIYEKIYLFLK